MLAQNIIHDYTVILILEKFKTEHKRTYVKILIKYSESNSYLHKRNKELN